VGEMSWFGRPKKIIANENELNAVNDS
jgi:hypothetical protein